MGKAAETAAPDVEKVHMLAVSDQVVSAPSVKVKRAAKPTGYVVWEDQFRVAIVTGFRKSKNVKTGPMLHVWVLVKAHNPIKAVQLGEDKLVCGMCPHRGTTCYVDRSRAPLAIWKKWMAGGYPLLTDYSLLSKWNIRYGAYGDPAFVPVKIWQALASASNDHTGYTHQWKQPWAQGLRGLVMASCDNPQEQIQAQAMGWRTFRIKKETDPVFASEISCPASAEMGKRTTCDKCRLCSGADKKARNITINIHGTNKAKFGVN